MSHNGVSSTPRHDSNSLVVIDTDCTGSCKCTIRSRPRRPLSFVFGECRTHCTLFAFNWVSVSINVLKKINDQFIEFMSWPSSDFVSDSRASECWICYHSELFFIYFDSQQV
jgi:hypothetical protein